MRKAVASRSRSKGPFEWNTPEPPLPESMTFLLDEPSKMSETTQYRLDYVTFNNVVGISAAVRNGKTVGLFSHATRSDDEGYSTFRSRLTSYFSGSEPIFIHFPLATGEKINAVAVRRRKNFDIPFSSPVVQVCHRHDIKWNAVLTYQGCHYAWKKL